MGRRRDVALSREAIAEVALAVLDEEGAEGLTVRRIADRLGVQSPSLYNHVSSKDEILDAVTELIGNQIDLTGLLDSDWRVGLATFARSYRQAFAAHPAALALIARRPVETAPALTAYDSALGALHRAGWSPRQALMVLGAVEYLVLGSALLPFSGGFVREPAGYEPAYPALASSLGAASLGSGSLGSVDHEAFELALELLLDRLDTMRTDQMPNDQLRHQGERSHT